VGNGVRPLSRLKVGGPRMLTSRVVDEWLGRSVSALPAHSTDARGAATYSAGGSNPFESIRFWAASNTLEADYCDR